MSVPLFSGLILGSFFFGYITTQIPGGFLASKYGGKNLFGGGILLASILTMLTPVATRRSVSWLIALRVAEGVAQVLHSKLYMLYCSPLGPCLFQAPFRKVYLWKGVNKERQFDKFYCNTSKMSALN